MIDPAYVQRHGELATMKSVDLARMLRERGYRLTRLNRKQDRVYALLYLEQWPVVMEVVERMGLEPVT